MTSPLTSWIERYSPDGLWREELRYRNGVLVRYSLSKRETPSEIVWSVWVMLEMHPKTKYLFQALKTHEEWTLKGETHSNDLVDSMKGILKELRDNSAYVTNRLDAISSVIDKEESHEEQPED